MEDTEFNQFIEFGNIFDRDTRQYLVRYLQQKVSPQLPASAPPPNPNDELAYLKDALDKVYQHQPLLKLSQEKYPGSPRNYQRYA
ncbi:MAG: hypothetical protein HC880_13175 [Bacteroidia bacterium]|nr:hypothetical protein [Bacteroidia bacterium]